MLELGLDIRGNRSIMATFVSEVVSFSSPNTTQTYIRYMADVPVRKADPRRDKAESDTTQVGVSIPQRKESTGLYDRVPLPLPMAFPIGLHAQFDPDTARSTLHETNWNKHRFEELGELIGEIARDIAAREPRRAWSVIPFDSEVPNAITDWISERFRVDVVEASHNRVRDTLVLATDAGELRVRFIFDPLSRLPFKLRGDLTLSGIRDSEAIEYLFRKAE